MSRTALLACLSLAACGGDPLAGPGDDPVDLSGPLALTTVSGDSQAGETGGLLGEFLVFRVTDSAGRPVAGLRVEWAVVSGGGQVSGKRHETDLEGLGAGNFTLGPEPGKNVARATVRGSLTVEFTAFALPVGPGGHP